MIPFPRSSLALPLVMALSGLSAIQAPLHGQLAGLGGPLAEADMLYMAGEPKLALDRVEAHLATDSTEYGAWWRAARAAVVLGIREEHHEAQNAWLDPAILFAEQAVALRPDGMDGLYWRGVASGRRAMNAGPGHAVELAEVVYRSAHTILAADSLHGGAHNMLGKLNYEIMSLSRVTRLIARTFMGNEALDDTSWENAEYHMHRAAILWPDFVLFHYDLGQLYEKRGRRELAIREMLHALSLPAVHPTDAAHQDQARELLRGWGVDPSTPPSTELTDHQPVPPPPERDAS